MHILAVLGSVSGIRSVERTHGRFYRPREPISRGWPLSLVAVLSRPGRHPNALHRRYRGNLYTLQADTSCGMLGIRICSVERMHGRLFRPRAAIELGDHVWRIQRHGGVTTRHVVDNEALQAPLTTTWRVEC